MDQAKAIEMLDSYKKAYPGTIFATDHLMVVTRLEILVKLCDIEKAIEDTELGQHAFRG